MMKPTIPWKNWSKRSPSPALGRQTTKLERITLLIGAGSLAAAVGSLMVAYLAFKQQQDTSDLRQQVKALAELAQQSRAQTSSLGEMAIASHDQVDMLASQLAAAHAALRQTEKQTLSLAKQADSGVTLARSGTQQANAALTALTVQQKAFSYGFRPQVRLLTEAFEGGYIKSGQLHLSLLLHTTFQGQVPALDFGHSAMLFPQKMSSFNYDEQVEKTCKSADFIGNARKMQLNSDDFTGYQAMENVDNLLSYEYYGDKVKSLHPVYIACASWRSQSDGSLHHSATIDLFVEIDPVTKANAPLNLSDRIFGPDSFRRYKLSSVND